VPQFSGKGGISPYRLPVPLRGLLVALLIGRQISEAITAPPEKKIPVSVAFFGRVIHELGPNLLPLDKEAGERPRDEKVLAGDRVLLFQNLRRLPELFFREVRPAGPQAKLGQVVPEEMTGKDLRQGGGN